jgi:hypothetical protein
MTPTPPSSCGGVMMAPAVPQAQQGCHVVEDTTTTTMEMQRHQQMLRELAAAPLHQEPDDFEDFMTRLPKAEDFGLQGFQEVPPEVFDEATGIWDHTAAAWSTPDNMMIDSAAGAAQHQKQQVVVPL